MRKHNHHGEGKNSKGTNNTGETKVRPLASEAGEEDNLHNYAGTAAHLQAAGETNHDEGVTENGKLDADTSYEIYFEV